jgi:hypothetical protein
VSGTESQNAGTSATATPGTESAQSNAAAAAPSSNEQTTTSSTTQSTTETNPSATGNENAQNNISDQNAGAAPASKSGKLPQTASPLPLLGLLGLGSLVTGLISRKK